MAAAVRPTPFDLVFGPLAAERFPALTAGLAAAGRDPRDRDQFVLVREVVELLRELRPDEGLGEGVDVLVGLLQQAYLFWLDGRRVAAVPRDTLERLLGPLEAEPTVAPAGRPPDRPTLYVQIASRRVWGEPVEAAPPEPLDGWFATIRGGRLALLAVFGMHEGREGFTVAEAAGERPSTLQRPDDSPLFAPRLAGGEAAGVFSVTGAEELLELAWRVELRLIPPQGLAPGTHQLVLA